MKRQTNCLKDSKALTVMGIINSFLEEMKVFGCLLKAGRTLFWYSKFDECVLHFVGREQDYPPGLIVFLNTWGTIRSLTAVCDRNCERPGKLDTSSHMPDNYKLESNHAEIFMHFFKYEIDYVSWSLYLQLLWTWLSFQQNHFQTILENYFSIIMKGFGAHKVLNHVTTSGQLPEKHVCDDGADLSRLVGIHQFCFVCSDRTHVLSGFILDNRKWGSMMRLDHRSSSDDVA